MSSTAMPLQTKQSKPFNAAAAPAMYVKEARALHRLLRFTLTPN